MGTIEEQKFWPRHLANNPQLKIIILITLQPNSTTTNYKTNTTSYYATQNVSHFKSSPRVQAGQVPG